MGQSAITRHFVTIRDGRWGPRQVCYRRAGSGAPLLLFHQSPLSSRDLVATLECWRPHFSCIAPDMPGYGLSDPIGPGPLEMADIARASIELLDALGIARAAVYGFHTGAMLAAAVAADHPQRIDCAVSNGFVVMDEPERADILANYLPAFAPSWDGAHLAWLWNRLREQTIFFPWYSKRPEDRLDYDLPPPAALQVALLDFLRAGDRYRSAYRAALAMRSQETLARIRVPMLVTASSTDVLAVHLARIRAVPSAVRVQPGGTSAETLDLCREFLRAHAGPPQPPPATVPASIVTAPIAGRMWQRMVELPDGQMRVRCNLDTPGRPLIVLHGAGASCDSLERAAASFIGRRPVIALELPGHGASDMMLPAARLTVGRLARAVAQALRSLGIGALDFFGMGLGGLIGLELARRQPRRVKHLVLADPPCVDPELLPEIEERFAPVIEPDAWGGHLLRSWQLVRDQRLFWPWYRRTRTAIIRRSAPLDAASIHREVLDLLAAQPLWRGACRAQFRYPLAERLAAAQVPLRIAASPGEAQLANARRAREAHPDNPVLELPTDERAWAEALLPFLDDRSEEAW